MAHTYMGFALFLKKLSHCAHWVALLMHSSDEMTENGPSHLVLLDI